MHISSSVPSGSLYSDLHFTLGTPLISLKGKMPSFEDLGSNQTHLVDEKVFYVKFSKCIEDLTFRLQAMDVSSHSNVYTQTISWMKKTLNFYFLKQGITACFKDFSEYASKHPLHLEIARKIYFLAWDLKRHTSHRSDLWNALSKTEQIFIHQMCLWTENLNVLKEPIDFQYLEDGRIERARQRNTITDFGQGVLFNIQPTLNQCHQDYYHFPLVHYPNFKVVKASPYHKQFFSFCILTQNQLLNRPAIGRLNEIFDVDTLESKIKKGGKNTTLYMNQLLTAFSCYRSGLCSALDLPVSLPCAIGRQGEWAVWPDEQEQELKDTFFSSSILADLHRFFHVEKLWNIQLFSYPHFSLNALLTVCYQHVVISGIPPLPIFSTQNFNERHQQLFTQLNLDPVSKKQWAELEEVSKIEQEKLAYQLAGIQILLDKNFLTLNDLMSCHPQALLMVRLISLIGQENFSNTPTESMQFLKVGTQLLSGLLSSNSCHSYTLEQALEEKGMQLTNQLMHSKQELKNLLVVFLVEKMEKKNSTENFIGNLLQIAQEKCLEIANELAAKLADQWPFEEKIQDHFFLLFSQDLLEELEQTLLKFYTPKENLSHHLLLLRAAANGHSLETDLQVINQKLHSVLHDAMVSQYSQAFLADINRIEFNTVN